MQFSPSRRKFLKLTAAAGAASMLPFPSSSFSAMAAFLSNNDDSPIRRISGSFSSTDFNGDDVTRPHDLLWRKEEFIASKGGRPSVSKQANVVVVGGGMAGLLSAYFLQHLQPVIIEQDMQFGGNSKGETYANSTYSIGAAYIVVPEEDSTIEKTLKDLGIRNQFRHETEDESRVIFQGIKSLWKGETGALESAQKVSKELHRIYEDAYPEIPWKSGSGLSLSELKRWDRETAKDWLMRVDPKLHPHIEEFYQLYGWSSFGGSLDELSAAQFANFIASETEGVLALPGGNSAITQALHKKLKAKLPRESMLSHSMVLEVKETSDGVEVLYVDQKENLQLIKAKAAVIATPKYVAGSIISNLDRERAELWRHLPYRAYLVSNVLLKEKVPSRAYDLFCLKGEVPETPRFGGRTDRSFTDIVYGSWAANDKDTKSILTLYRPYPFDGARNLISGKYAHDRTVREVEKELPEILKQLGISERSIAGTRVTRWGHAIPLARTGFIHDGTIDKIGAPMGRIFFANQDNYMNPAFETAFAAAEIATKDLQKTLRTFR
ncbi:MAG: FAD-dependent oxidoreductase [Oligoflexia bacterium]|nr:FAD-dependent oxidoreductase [Oligoflexia bacterium]